jgi:23S rRNA pseudouridine2605 synthase
MLPCRIAKYLAHTGCGSRREAERWIAEGRVACNGQPVLHPSHQVHAQDRITLDGKRWSLPQRPRVFRYHKPRKVMTTHHDPEGRDTVFCTLPQGMPRVVSVGRLDYDSEGLLLLTTDGTVAGNLAHPSRAIPRVYRARGWGMLAQDAVDAIQSGTCIDGIHYRPAQIAVLAAPSSARIHSTRWGTFWIEITVHEGKTHEVRHLCRYAGLEVERLIRTAYGPAVLGDLPPYAVAEIPYRNLSTWGWVGRDG